MNTYTYQFVCACPANGKPIIYNLEITASFMIRVEHIMLACHLYQQAYHEAIAGGIHERFGGLVVLKAHHHGVDIVTRLGDPHVPRKAVQFTEANPA